MQPDFLQPGDILSIHRDQIARRGGSWGLRDIGLLESAVGVAQAGFGDDYFHEDLFEMAAAYLYHIVQDHPFVDGNKRTGGAAALVFLRINGVSLEADNEGLEALVRDVAQGGAGKARIAEFFRGLAG